MSMYYEGSWRVEARDIDLFDQCRPSAVLNYLQEAATQASAQLNASRYDILEHYNSVWMLVRMRYRLDRPLYWDETLTIRTWNRPGRGVSIYRDFDLYRDGEPVGEAVSTWVIARVDDRKLLRPGELPQLQGKDGGELCRSTQLHRIAMPADMPPGEARALHYSDADPNGHVNNVRYADFACDALHLEREGQGKFVSSFQISYLKECRIGEALDLSAAQRDGVWYIRGSAAGASRFEAAVTLDRLPEGLRPIPGGSAPAER